MTPKINSANDIVYYGDDKFYICLLLSKDDLREYLDQEEIDNIGDHVMSEIASKIGSSLMDFFWVSLETILTDMGIKEG